MTIFEKTEHVVKGLMYEKGRNKGHRPKKDNKSFFNELLESLDEMEEYIDDKLKEHQISKKK